MKCEENGDGVKVEAGRRAVKRKRRAGGARDVRLLPTAPQHARRAPPPLAPPRAPTPSLVNQPPPFLPPLSNVNLMEEITFWVCTRRAPCLYRYNNVYKKKDDADCSKYRYSSDPSCAGEVPSPKKKKRKLRLLDNESVSSEGQNVYFERSHKHRRSWCSSSKSQSDRSDVDFNIKNSSIRNKTKSSKLQRKNHTTLHKKNKIITSTPKPTTLRRSLRKTQQNLNNSTQLNCSLCIFNSKATNGEHEPAQRENGDEQNKSVNRNRTPNNKKGTVLQEQSKNEIVPNGQFEDISDVSGFTANYIRSTKMNSKTPRKVRNKASRNLVRESQQKLQKDESKIIVCMNKSTALPAPVLNQSTDSSQNVINLVTVNNNNNEKSLKVNQSTSQTKLLSSKTDPIKENEKDTRQILNISFQSKSSGVSRYPTRHRNNSKTVTQDLENSINHSTPIKKVSKGARELKSANQNELHDVSLVSRTRSGKIIGVVSMDLEESGCSQGQVNNLIDRVGSSVTKNAASPVSKSVRKKKLVTSKKSADRQQELKDSESDSAKKKLGSLALSPTKCVGRRAVDKIRQSLKRDSLRDKSGFSACFSDSEEDKPLIRRKFFC